MLVSSRGVRAVALGGSGSWNLQILDSAEQQVNSTGLILFGDPEPDDFRALTLALARMKYKQLNEWTEVTPRHFTADVERF